MLQIRSETIPDYAEIAALHARAFGEHPAEALIVALHRQRPTLHPDLSLVADQDGRIVGHALFSQHSVRLLSQDVRAVNLAPLAVDPLAQRQGIGARLIAAGHTTAR